jgi:hypothetical protein
VDIVAVDTRDKRASCIGFDFPSRAVFPNPDGSFNQGDRQHIAYVYRGIDAGEAVVAAAEAMKHFVGDVNYPYKSAKRKKL